MWYQHKFLRWLGHNGTAAMNGKLKVSKLLYNRKIFNCTLYVHCVSYSLNLALSNTVFVVPIRKSFSVIEKVHLFFNTPKCQII